MAQDDEPDQMSDRMIKGKTPEQMLGEGGLLKDLTKRLVERTLNGELTEHLGYKPHAAEGRGTGNSRNGSTPKRVLTEGGALQLDVPRDGAGEFERQVVKQGQRQLMGFDEKVIALYARALSTRDIQGHLEDVYGSAVQMRAVSVALGIRTDGHKELLGLWQGKREGSKFWLNVLTEIKNQRAHGDVAPNSRHGPRRARCPESTARVEARRRGRASPHWQPTRGHAPSRSDVRCPWR